MAASGLDYQREHRRQLRRLGEMLAGARRERGLRQVDVASRLGRSQSYVAKYEVGERRLDAYELALVCAALELDPVTAIASFLAGLPARGA